MDYQKKFSLPRLQGEFVLAQWERGYRRLHLYFRDRLIAEINSPAKLKKGVKFTDPELNRVEIVLAGKPLSLNLITDNFHSPSNRIHPYREILDSRRLLWVVVFFAFISVLLLLPNFGSFDFWLNTLSVGIYLLPIFLIPKQHYWSFFLALGWFSLFTLLTGALTFLGAFGFNIILFFVFAARVVILILLIRYAKDAASALRHKRHANMASEELLDELSAG